MLEIMFVYILYLYWTLCLNQYSICSSYGNYYYIFSQNVRNKTRGCIYWTKVFDKLALNTWLFVALQCLHENMFFIHMCITGVKCRRLIMGSEMMDKLWYLSILLAEDLWRQMWEVHIAGAPSCHVTQSTVCYDLNLANLLENQKSGLPCIIMNMGWKGSNSQILSAIKKGVVESKNGQNVVTMPCIMSL